MSSPHSTPSTATFSRRVEWVDTDASGHHHNGLVVRIVEAAEAELMAKAGILSEYFSSAPRVRHEIDFSAPLFFGQQVSATVVVEKLGRSSITLSFEVWGEALADRPRSLAASGKVVAAHVPEGTERSTPWPDAMVQALTPRTPRI